MRAGIEELLVILVREAHVGVEGREEGRLQVELLAIVREEALLREGTEAFDDALGRLVSLGNAFFAGERAEAGRTVLLRRFRDRECHEGELRVELRDWEADAFQGWRVFHVLSPLGVSRSKH